MLYKTVNKAELEFDVTRFKHLKAFLGSPRIPFFGKMLLESV